MIPKLNAKAMAQGDPKTMATLKDAATQVGFFAVTDTALTGDRVRDVFEVYRDFFKLPHGVKQNVDMSLTGSNRGWGASGSEQVDPNANPDYKQFFDCGFALKAGDKHSDKGVYAPNVWPDDTHFRDVTLAYYNDALQVSKDILDAVIRAVEANAAHFDGAFDEPMALLRGNYYPERPDWAGGKDFGIATHTDYGCLTLLATDGTPGLEVRKRGGGWIPVQAPPGDFIINFGEMLEFWTGGKVVATPHRVVGGTQERLSIPMFFNPSFDTNVAPPQSDEVILAGTHLTKRFEETYVHLKQ